MVSVSDAAFARPWQHFYARGVPHTVDIPDIPVTRLLDDAAQQYGRRTALVYFGRKITYARLLKLVDLFADGLADLGVRRGDRVALILPNCPQFTIAWFAVLRIGAVAVPFTPLYTADEMRHQLSNSGATVAIAFDQSYDLLDRARLDTQLKHLVLTSWGRTDRCATVSDTVVNAFYKAHLNAPLAPELGSTMAGDPNLAADQLAPPTTTSASPSPSATSTKK